MSLSSNLIDQFKVAFFYIGILGCGLPKLMHVKAQCPQIENIKYWLKKGQWVHEIFSYRMCRVYWEYFS